MGFGVAAIASWGIAETLATSIDRSKMQRGFTGSREHGSFSGLDFPITNGADQGKIRLDPSIWTLTIKGKVNKPLTWSYNDILALSNSEITAIIDCTGGWYSAQIWRGVCLVDLLAQTEIQEEKYIVTLRDVSGYTSHFTPAEISEIVLATHVGDKVLNHWHGYPMRAVVPSRRGGHWVKWLTEIEVT
jgi:DMSO/TMAO reductase YedYZ molybdopterin-dependent catalytic subunit